MISLCIPINSSAKRRQILSPSLPRWIARFCGVQNVLWVFPKLFSSSQVSLRGRFELKGIHDSSRKWNTRIQDKSDPFKEFENMIWFLGLKSLSDPIFKLPPTKVDSHFTLCMQIVLPCLLCLFRHTLESRTVLETRNKNEIFSW